MNLLSGTVRKAFLGEFCKLADSPIYGEEKTNDDEYYSNKLGKDPEKKDQKGFYFRSRNDIIIRK